MVPRNDFIFNSRCVVRITSNSKTENDLCKMPLGLKDCLCTLQNLFESNVCLQPCNSRPLKKVNSNH